MRLVANHPEEKILIVIGASHKSFLEKYLKQMPDIELFQF
jgi:pheromone shutdown protein TraB